MSHTSHTTGLPDTTPAETQAGMQHRPTEAPVCEALLTDLYQLTMVQAYWREGLTDTAVFSLATRALPARRNYLVAAGVDEALGYLERLRFDEEALEWMAHRAEFHPAFVAWMRAFRFRGDVRAVPEGTPVFGFEPILEVSASLPEAQLAETLLVNRIHLHTVLASKASRMVVAADGVPVIDFGLRRAHGSEAGLAAARAAWLAGAEATSNVLAGIRYGIPLAGTMGHSYIQAHAHEADAFGAFATAYPGCTLLVDTYDTLEGVRRVIGLTSGNGAARHVGGIRLDSGDLGPLAFAARGMLDAAGLERVRIVASGGLDEDRIAELRRSRAPIDGFGVGTELAVARDVPALDMVYKLTEYAGTGRIKLSSGKAVYPGAKQIFRQEDGGEARGDLVSGMHEAREGRPLLKVVMRGGARTPAGRTSLTAARALARAELASLPAQVRSLAAPGVPYAVRISEDLSAARDALARTVVT